MSETLVLRQELLQCRDLLASYSIDADPLNGEEPLSPELRLVFMATSVFLVIFAGLMAGLTLGLLSLDKVDLEVIKRSGTAKEVWLVERVEPVLARPHFLLATLLLCNSCAMEALPLFLDRLLNPAAAIILSVSAILIFGEIVPQAVCKRYGLQVGAYLSWFVSFLMLLTAPITWPIGKLLDLVLGEESTLFKRRELKALVSIHADPAEDGESAPALTLDEVQVIQGALDMASKTAEAAMTPIDKVVLVSSDDEVNDELLLAILRRGHSRLPVYAGGDKQNIVGLLLVKELLLVDEDAGVKIADLPLRELPFIDADTMLYDVLKIFQLGRAHMGCLTRTDDSGRTQAVGIITIEDVLEELLQQEIVDETDQYVDNLQTVPTRTLQSLQQLPQHLRQYLTQSIMHAPQQTQQAQQAQLAQHPHATLAAAAAQSAAAAAAASAPAHGGNSPRAVAAAVAAAAATSVLLSPRRGRQQQLGHEGIERVAAEAACAAAGGAAHHPSGDVQAPGAQDVPPAPQPLAALLARSKPPVPRRTASSSRLRDAGREAGGTHSRSPAGRWRLERLSSAGSGGAELRRPLLEPSEQQPASEEHPNQSTAEGMPWDRFLSPQSMQSAGTQAEAGPGAAQAADVRRGRQGQLQSLLGAVEPLPSPFDGQPAGQAGHEPGDDLV